MLGNVRFYILKFRGICTALLLLSMLLPACGGPSSSSNSSGSGTVEQPTTDDTNPLKVTVLPASDSSASGLIGKAGGVISASYNGVQYTLTVPADALVIDQQITVTPIATISDSPLGNDSGFTGGVHMEPEGLFFSKPATLTIQLPTAPSGMQVGFGYTQDGADFHLTPITESGDVITISIDHFSGVGVTATTLSDVEAILSLIPKGTADYYIQQIEAIMASAREKVSQGTSEAQATSEAISQAQPLLEEWLTTIVVPDLENTLAGDAASLMITAQEDIKNAIVWQRTVDSLGLGSGSFDPRIESLIQQILQKAGDYAISELQFWISNDPYTASDHFLGASGSITQAIEISGLMEAFGLDTADNYSQQMNDIIYQIYPKAVDSAGALCPQDKTIVNDIRSMSGELLMFGGPDITEHAMDLIVSCSNLQPKPVNVVSAVDGNGGKSAKVTITWTVPPDWAATTTAGSDWSNATSASFENTGYKVYYKSYGQADFTSPNMSFGAGDTTATITSLAPGTEYCFAVTQEKVDIGESITLGTQQCVTTSGTPAAPEGVTTVAGDSSATISWNASTNATSYNLWWTLDSVTWTKIAVGGALTYTHTGLTNGATYCYYVQAVNDELGTISPESAHVCAMPEVKGCTDPTATNYNQNATVEDGSCIYAVTGCTDPTATNYNQNATVEDGSCVYAVTGCTDPTATNYNPNATVDDGSCIISNIGVTWTQQTLPSGLSSLYSVAWDGTRFIAVGAKNNNKAYLTSSDGVTWSEFQWGENLTTSLIWDGAFLRVPINNITYPPGTNVGSGYVYINDAVWDGSRYVAALYNSDVVSSTDGINWTWLSNPNFKQVYSIAWNGSHYVIGTAGGVLLTSADGVTWSATKVASSQSVIWTGTQFVSMGLYGSIVTSPDGFNWTEIQVFEYNKPGFSRLASDGNLIVGVGNAIFTSPDGVTWIQRSIPAGITLNAVIGNGTRFVAVGKDAAGGVILTSP